MTCTVSPPPQKRVTHLWRELCLILIDFQTFLTTEKPVKFTTKWLFVIAPFYALEIMWLACCRQFDVYWLFLYLHLLLIARHSTLSLDGLAPSEDMPISLSKFSWCFDVGPWTVVVRVVTFPTSNSSRYRCSYVANCRVVFNSISLRTSFTRRHLVRCRRIERLI